MIEATIKYTGSFIDKPSSIKILIRDESVVAVRRKDEETNKIEQLTVEQLFDSFLKKSNYLKGGQGEVDHTLFESWFSQKHIKNSSLENRIISIEYKRV